MNAIVNVNPHWGIGKNGKLLVSIPSDLHRFRELTLHKTVIYGRKTLATFPNGLPLADRENIILSKDPNFAPEGAIVCRDMDQLKSLLRERYSDNLFVIGGESVYKLLVPYCEKAYVTFSYVEVRADRHFPNLNRNENWSVTSIQPTQIEGHISFRFVEYTNARPMSLSGGA